MNLLLMNHQLTSLMEKVNKVKVKNRRKRLNLSLSLGNVLTIRSCFMK